ncbi:C39 family peptidase [Marinobacter sp. SS5-14b]|uniref:C39 family peptidase n=1 Tax=Marinobacter sp. SS5-14b TaxID=3050456 RepID=UPI0026E0532A|nr:C39 family peptidase [Marinobacter sp. SS5-14b]
MVGRWHLLSGVLACLLWTTCFAGTVLVPGPSGDLAVGVSSFQDQRFQSVLRQQYDFSCGSAAVASLLSFHYDKPVSEQDVFANMLALADQDKVRKEGFSMLDMKRYLESEGYRADGFRMPLSGLRDQVRVPVIALVTLGGYRHFVVIKGISEREVLVGDPARGLKAYSLNEFEQHWDGSAFVIRSHLEQGRASFLAKNDWPGLARAPLFKGLGQPALGHTLPYWPSTQDW